ncbi:MAG: hypothetical protein ABSF46_13565 [Terriglobia bacterium]
MSEITITEDTATRSATSSPWSYGLIAIAAALLAGVMGLRGGRDAADAEWYGMIAQGHMQSVLEPFASRQLEARSVEALVALVPMGVDRGFALLALLSTLVCVGGAGYLLYRASVPAPLFAAAALLPVWAAFDHAYMLPDIFFSALLMLFLVCLWRKSYWLAAGMLFPLYIAREATVLVLLCFLIAGMRILRARVMAGAALAAGAGALVTHYLASGSDSNRHNLPALVYLLAKVPYNLAKNVFGVQLWSNTITLGEPPYWTWRVPAGLHLGAIKVIGICPFHLHFLYSTLLCWMGAFGVLPLLLYIALRQGRFEGARSDLLMRFCLLYGLISFAIGPLLGASVYRLVLQGWPAFLVALPLCWPVKSIPLLRKEGSGVVPGRRGNHPPPPAPPPAEEGSHFHTSLIPVNLLCGWVSAAAVGILSRGEGRDYAWAGLIVVVACWAFTYRKSNVTARESA